jgi:hypothetical protein
MLNQNSLSDRTQAILSKFTHPYSQQKARHDEAVALFCLNTPSAITLLRSLETGDARSKQAAPDYAGLRPTLRWRDA